MQLGRKFTIGKECYPCILTTGDMLKTVRKEGFEPGASAFFMPSGRGPCRFGQYHRLHRMVLDEQGFENVPIYAPNQDEKLYQELNIVGGKFSRLGWRAIVSTDMLLKMLHGVRPYEEVPGQTQQVYNEMLGAVSKAIESRNNGLFEVLEHAAKSFLSISTKSVEKPIVGIVGEIYIRSNRFSNDDLVEKGGGVRGRSVACADNRMDKLRQLHGEEEECTKEKSVQSAFHGVDRSHSAEG